MMGAIALLSKNLDFGEAEIVLASQLHPNIPA
jgi:hypothetical protein